MRKFRRLHTYWATRGSSWFGKKLLAAFLYGQLPEAIHKDFDAEYGLDKLSITKLVYQQPNANVFGELHDVFGTAQGNPFVQAYFIERASRLFLTFMSSVLKSPQLAHPLCWQRRLPFPRGLEKGVCRSWVSGREHHQKAN